MLPVGDHVGNACLFQLTQPCQGGGPLSPRCPDVEPGDEDQGPSRGQGLGAEVFCRPDPLLGPPGLGRAGGLDRGSRPRPSTTRPLLSPVEMSASLTSLIPRPATHARRTDHPRLPLVPWAGFRRSAKAHAPKVTSPHPLQLPTQTPPCLLQPAAGTGNNLRAVGGGELNRGGRVASGRF